MRGLPFLLIAISLATACNRTAPPPAPLPPKDADDNVRVERAIEGAINEPFAKGHPTYFFVEITTNVADVTLDRFYDGDTGHCHRLAETPDRFLARQKSGTASVPGGRVRISNIADGVDYSAPGLPELCPSMPPGTGSRLDYRSGGQSHSVRFMFASGEATKSRLRLPASLAATPTLVAATTKSPSPSGDDDDGVAVLAAQASLDPNEIYLLGVSSASPTKERVLALLSTPRDVMSGFAFGGMRATILADGRLAQIDGGSALVFQRGVPSKMPMRSCLELSNANRAGLAWIAQDMSTGELVQACDVFDDKGRGQVDDDWVQSIYVDGTHVPRRDRLAGEVLGAPVAGKFPAKGCHSLPGPTPSQPTVECGFFVFPSSGDPILTKVPRAKAYVIRSIATGFLVAPVEDRPREVWQVDLAGTAKRLHSLAPLPAGVNESVENGALALGPDGAVYQFGGRAVYRRDATSARVVYSEPTSGTYVRAGGSLETELVTGGAVSFFR